MIEAGPCFVTGIRRAERDGYDAVQVAFGETREKSLNKPKLGLLKKAGVGNLQAPAPSSAASRASSRWAPS